MAAKFSPQRRAAFLAALAETGNQTLAAERARVSRSWVSLHRGSDPAFRTRMDAAIAAARARLKDAASLSPERRWQTQAGEELTVRGTNGRFQQVARARLKQWTPRAEERFLAHLRATCNVAAACREVGLSPPSVYGHRHRWSAFAARWDEALEDGYDLLSSAMVAQAGAMLGDREMVPEVPMPGMSFADGLALLQLYRRKMAGEPHNPRRRRRPRTMDEARDSILTKLEAIERHRLREERLAAAADGRSA